MTALTGRGIVSNRFGISLLIMAAFGLAALAGGVGAGDSSPGENQTGATWGTPPLAFTSADLGGVNWLTDENLTNFLAVLAATPTIPYADLATNSAGVQVSGTFYSLQHLGEWPPLPFDPSRSAVWKMSNCFLVDDLGVKYDSIGKSRTKLSSGESVFVDAVSGPPSFSDTNSSGTNVETSDVSFLNYVPYGTNLYLAQVVVNSSYASGIISNTTPGVRLELQYTFDLTQPWQSADWYVYGAPATNWTAWSVPVVGTSNLFLRVRSWAVDVNGLPIWWEQQYGLTNVDANTQDSAGDGWTLYQKYALGVNPNTFYTPGTPQGLTVTFNQSAMTAAVSWIPSPGKVVNYTLEKSYQAHAGGTAQVNDYAISGTSYQDSISGNSPDVANGNAYNVTYRLKANYQNGQSTSWTPTVPLQQTTVAAAIVPGASGMSTIVTMGVPANAALVQLVFIDENAVSNKNNSYNYNEDIPVGSITNNTYPLPTGWIPRATDAYGNANYAIFAQSVDARGNSSAPNLITATNWAGASFYDGRQQLKDNLVFQLREASSLGAISLYFPTNEANPYPVETDQWYEYPSNYACSGLYPFTGPEYYDGATNV